MLNERQGFRKYADISLPGNAIQKVIENAWSHLRRHGYKPDDFVIIEVKRGHQL